MFHLKQPPLGDYNQQLEQYMNLPRYPLDGTYNNSEPQYYPPQQQQQQQIQQPQQFIQQPQQFIQQPQQQQPQNNFRQFKENVKIFALTSRSNFKSRHIFRYILNVN